MNIKKSLVLSLLMMHALVQPSNIIVPPPATKDYSFKTIATTGVAASATALIVYLWATSGETVEERIANARQKLATMPEYENQFDTSIIFGEKETQIKSNLKNLNIDMNNLGSAFDQKLRDDLATIKNTYANLWYKSFYGGCEIAELTRKVYQIQIKIESLLKYIQGHYTFTRGHKIIQESDLLISRNPFKNTDEIVKIARSYDTKSAIPLYKYVKKIQQDLDCITFLTTEKNGLRDYPELSAMIAQYQPTLVEIKAIITAMEDYKQEAFYKLEHDIAELTEKYNKLEQLVRQLQVDVQIAKMQSLRRQ